MEQVKILKVLEEYPKLEVLILNSFNDLEIC